MYRIFIDDERDPVDGGWAICRTSNQAILCVRRYGLPEFISFDHDLQGDDTAMKFVHWLVDYMLDRDLKFPFNFDFHVHSQNPVGANNIRSLMNNLIRDRGRHDLPPD